jgi:aspartate aminotransferase
MYTENELGDLAAVLRKHPQVVILTDDMYNRLVFDGKKIAPHILRVAPDLKDRTVVINGGSKAYSMTGWRIGWAAGPENLITAMGDYQSQATGCPSSIAQHAALAALKNCEKDIEGVVEKLIHRKKVAMETFKKIPQFKIVEPDGAFYLWVDIRGALGKKFEGKAVETSKEFCDILLNKFYVATVPGIESGNEGYMRLSFAVSEASMAQAIERMAEMVNGLT